MSIISNEASVVNDDAVEQGASAPVTVVYAFPHKWVPTNA